MTTTEPTAPENPGGPGPAARGDESGRPVATLRGAGVEVDFRLVGRVVVAGCLVALAVLAAIFFAAGVGKNAQINSLRDHGVPVTVTVSGCIGLMGGSGSNLAGYSCQGTFVLGGHSHSDAIPGGSFYRHGTTFRGISVPSDPGLLSTPGILATQHASWRVFLLPTILVVLLVLLGGGIFWRWRNGRPGQSGAPVPQPSDAK